MTTPRGRRTITPGPPPVAQAGRGAPNPPHRRAAWRLLVLVLALPVLADATITYTTPTVGADGSCDGAGGSSPILTELFECLLFRNGNFEGPVPCDGVPVVTAASSGDVFGFRVCGRCGDDIAVTGQCTEGQMGLEEQVTIGEPAAGTVTVVVTGDPPPDPDPQCNDGLDNDGDGDIDFPADDGCSDALDDDESDDPPPPPPPACDNVTVMCQCSDEMDNDGDGLAEWEDCPQCTPRMRADPDCNGDPFDNDESA